MSTSTSHVPVLHCIVSAFLFLRRNLGYIYATGSLYILVNVISFWLSWFFAPGSAPFTLGAALGLLNIPLMVVLFVLWLRRAIGQTKPGQAAAPVGADALRVLGTGFAVFGITAFIAFIAFIFSMFAVSGVIASVVDPAVIETEPASAFARSGLAGHGAAIVAAAGIWALLLYVMARFSPAFPASIAQKRIVVFEAAAWSKGQGWRMALAILGVSLPFYALLAPGAYQYFRLIMAAMPTDGSLQSAMAVHLDLKPLWWFFMLSAFLWPAIIGVKSGLYAIFYRGLRAGTGDDS